MVLLQFRLTGHKPLRVNGRSERICTSETELFVRSVPTLWAAVVNLGQRNINFTKMKAGGYHVGSL